MASTYSTNLALELIGNGDQAGTWGTTTNTNLGTLLEQAISGYVTQAVATGTDTTITIPNGASGVARNMYIELTGTGGASTNLIVPANKKLYFIYNHTSSGQVTVKVSGQTGVSVPNGGKYLLVCNGTDIVLATITDLANQVTGVLPVANGGTGTSLGLNNTANYWNAQQTFYGSSTVFPAVFSNIVETAYVTGLAPSATTTISVSAGLDGSIKYFTGTASTNWTLNLTYANGTTTLNSALSNGQSITIAILTTQGTTAYYNTAVQIDGASVTPKWQGGSAPTAGNASGIDVYTYTIIKTASATYTVLASQTKFA